MTESAKIKWVRYVLAVWNFTTSVNYYQQQLGFITWWAGDGWHFLKRQKYLVMLGGASGRSICI